MAIEVLLIIVSLLINTKIFDSSYNRVTMVMAINNEYLKNSYFMVNLITSVFVIGLPTLMNRSFEKVMLTIKNRGDLILSKIISGIIMVLIVTIVSGSIFIFIPAVSIKGFIINNEIMYYFVRLFLQLIFIYFIASIIWELTENNLTLALTTAIFFIVLINNQNYIQINFFIRLTQKIFPVMLLNGKNSMFLHGELYVLIYSIIGIIIFRYICLNKDINN